MDFHGLSRIFHGFSCIFMRLQLLASCWRQDGQVADAQQNEAALHNLEGLREVVDLRDLQSRASKKS